MGLKTRGSRTYFYRNVRLRGRVVTEYVGSGERAEVAAAEAEEVRAGRMAVKARIVEDLEHERIVADYFRDVDRLVSDALHAAGYHRHDRGPWRKARTPRTG